MEVLKEPSPNLIREPACMMRSHRCTRQRLANHLRKIFERQVYTSVVGIDVAMISPSSTSKYRNDLVDQSLEVLSAPLLDNSFGNDGVAEQSCCSFDCRRRWSMFIIILLSLLNFTCRFTYAGVLSQLQEQFQKTDGEMGFSQTAFVLAYMFAAPIFGYLNDAQYFSCRSLVTVSCLIFSGAAFCSGLSSTYLEFLASRAVLGVGEAGFSVLAPIIIKALFEGSKSQPTAIALYYSSTAVGSALGFIVGGTVGGHWGWRYAFFSAGPPGVLLSVLFLVSAKTESANSIRAVAKHRSKDGGTVSADVVSLLRVSSYMFSTFGFASLTFAVSGLAAFMPVYLARQTDIKESVASTSFGVVACLSGIIGPFSGDALTKYLAKKRNDAAVYVCALGLGLSVPFGVASILIPYFELPFSVILCYASSFLAQLFFFSIMSPNLGILFSVVPERLHATGLGMQLLVSHFFGDAISTGFVSNHFQNTLLFEAGDALCFSLCVAMFVVVLGTLCYSFALTSFDRNKQDKLRADDAGFRGGDV